MAKSERIAGRIRETDTTRNVNLMERVVKFNSRLANVFSWVAGAALVSMMILTCADVAFRNFGQIVQRLNLILLTKEFTNFLLRYIGQSIPGTFEIVGYLGSVIVAFSIAYTQLLGGHIAIDWVVARFPANIQTWFKIIVSLVGAALFTLIAWQSWRFAGDLWLSGEVSPTQKIPFFPFVYGIALASVPVVLILLLDFIKQIIQVVRK